MLYGPNLVGQPLNRLELKGMIIDIFEQWNVTDRYTQGPSRLRYWIHLPHRAQVMAKF